MQRDATNASVILPPGEGAGYTFSFQAQFAKIAFAAGSTQPLATQLGDIKAICGVLFASKINSLDNIRRERVSADDASGQQTDYLSEKSVTNELAILAPYELTFHCFSAELASLLNGFVNSSNGMVVKTINVEQSPASAQATLNPAAPVAPIIVPSQVVPQANAEQLYRSRYGLGGAGPGASRYGAGAERYGAGAGMPGGVPYRPVGSGQGAYPTPAPAPAPTGTTTPGGAGKGGLPTVLDENQLKVTMTLMLVKMLPPK
jgi:hypothetical protein